MISSNVQHDSPVEAWQRFPFVVTDGLVRCVLVASRALRPGRTADGRAEVVAGPLVVRGELGLAFYADGGYRIGRTVFTPIDPEMTPDGLFTMLETQRRGDLRETLLNPAWLASRRPKSRATGESPCSAT
jgi:hypothetical protein